MARKYTWRGISLLLVITLFVALLPSTALADQPKVHLMLTVLHNNDGESDLINLGSGLEDFGGAARFKTVVDDLKWQAKYAPVDENPSERKVVMVSSGDNFLAGPEFNASLENGIPYYDTIAMDLIGYDAVAIGNHDLDFGPDVLADFIAGYTVTKPLYLSANLDVKPEPRLKALIKQRRIAHSMVIKGPGVRVGIIGATTPNLPFISSPRNININADVAGAVMAEVDKLNSKGVKVIILISHLQNINEDLELAKMIDGVDIMVAGGGDELLANPGDLLVPDGTQVFGGYPLYASDKDGTQVPVVTTQGSYGYVGRLVAGFDKQGNLLMIDEELSGPVRIAGDDCGGTLPCDDAVEPDPMVQSLAVDPVVAYLADLATNQIGTSEVDLDGRRAPGVRTKETNEGNLVADALFWQATQLAASYNVTPPDVSLQNGGGIRNNNIIPAGPITALDTFSILPFPNFLSVVENISREQFKEIMENAVACTQSGDIVTNPNCGTGRFAQIAGFRFTWSASGVGQILDLESNVVVPGTRVQEIVLDSGEVIVSGGNVVPGAPLSVATIDFLAKDGDQYPFRGAPFTTLGVTYQQALQNYIEGGLGGLISAAQYPFDGQDRIFPVP